MLASYWALLEVPPSGAPEVTVALVETPSAWIAAHAQGHHMVCCLLRFDRAAEALSPAWHVIPETAALATRLDQALRDAWRRPSWLGRAA